MDKSPAFQFYPDKWKAQTDHLSAMAYRAYHKLLCWMWLNAKDYCSIADTDTAWAKATGLSGKPLAKARAEIMDPEQPLLKPKRNARTFLHSLGLKKEANKQRLRRQHGQKGAKARWRKEKGTMPEQCPSTERASVEQYPPSSSPSSSVKKKETPPISPSGPTPEATVHFLAAYSEVFPDRIREGNLQLPGWRANGNHKGWQAWAESQPSAVLEAITAKELRAAKAYGIDRNLHFGPGTFDMYRREAKKPTRKTVPSKDAGLVEEFYRQPSAVTRKYLVAHNNDMQQAAEAWQQEQETKT